MGLLRQYFSVGKRDTERKFKHPLNEESDLLRDNKFKLYDEL